MKPLPRASALIMEKWMTDPVTDVRDIEVSQHFLLEPELATTPNGNYEVSYWDGSETMDIRSFVLTGVEQIAGVTTGVFEGSDSTAIIRAVEPADALHLAPAGVPQPIDVVEAHVIRGGGMLAGEVDAAVAADNSVVTLVLDTGLGLYVRYSGDWQLLPEKSSSLDGLALHPVAPEALGIFDAADAAAQPISVFDLPRTIDNYYTDAEDQEESEIEVAPPPPGPTVAAIDSALALSNALRINQSGADWYVRKRQQALHPGGTGRQQQDLIVAAAVDYLAGMREGLNADPQGLIRRDLIRRARVAGVLNHPAVIAAVDWRDWLHPRGRDGKFVHKSGLVNIFKSATDPLNKPSERGRVSGLTQRGVEVQMFGKDGKTPTGEVRVINPSLLAEFRPTATLNPETGGEGSKTGTLADTFP